MLRLHLLVVVSWFSGNRPRSDAELPRLNSDLRAREDKYRRSEFSLGNSASDLGLSGPIPSQNPKLLCLLMEFDWGDIYSREMVRYQVSGSTRQTISS
ncbi:hypothetical protein OUZ56_026795 [Daphnia magna]|uniref:Uncharacterized protein n=1 Tax=Daphnia magna TaxID=35525 RepID=A0ABQ9ZMU0_9CRUS|nr:hypothetical protein OUZ56_026795 [Daphnia magna]